MKTYSFKSLSLAAFYAGTTLALIGSSLSESADASPPPPITKVFTKMVEDKFEKVEFLYGDVKPDADFYIFVLVDFLTHKYEYSHHNPVDIPITKALFTGPLKPMYNIRSNTKMEVILCHTYLTIASQKVLRREYIKDTYKKLRVRVPIIAALKFESYSNVGDSVFIVSKDHKLLFQGEDEILAYWRDYTLRPISEKKREEKTKRFRKKRDLAIYKYVLKNTNPAYIQNTYGDDNPSKKSKGSKK